jgi:hypothetical protein
MYTLNEGHPCRRRIADVCTALVSEAVIGQVLHATIPWEVEGRSLWKMRSTQLTRMWREFA